MAGPKRVEVIIDDDGVHMDYKDFPGMSCQAATKAIEAELDSLGISIGETVAVRKHGDARAVVQKQRERA